MPEPAKPPETTPPAKPPETTPKTYTEEEYKGVQRVVAEKDKELNTFTPVRERIQKIREAYPQTATMSDEEILDAVINNAKPVATEIEPNPEKEPEDEPFETKVTKQVAGVKGYVVSAALSNRGLLDKREFLANNKNPDGTPKFTREELTKMDNYVREELARAGDINRVPDHNLYQKAQARLLTDDPAYGDKYYESRKQAEEKERAEKGRDPSLVGGPGPGEAPTKHMVETKAGPKSVKVFADEVE